ncbi:leucine-rich repeat-containing protein 63 isoform X2 [Petromyzon marinus]|uniref:leucine-rich repeat-containing protein 63 isoform X2 n=1 Tax=Petromyzon marinus TaxID=7757 RepID=UPI003F717DF1
MTDSTRLLRRPLPPAPPALPTSPTPRATHPTPSTPVPDWSRPEWSSGPAHLPPSRPFRLPRLRAVATGKQRHGNPPIFTLDDFLAFPPFDPVTQTKWLRQAVLSRCNYGNLVRMLASTLEKGHCGHSKHREVTDVISVQAIPAVPPARVPKLQLLLEMRAFIQEHMAALTIGTLDDDELREKWNTEKSQHLQSKWEPHDKESLIQPAIGLVLHAVPGGSFQGEVRSRSPFSTIISPAELAVLHCLLQGGTTLSLKAHFIDSLPGLSPLIDTLVYLNLSYNNLRSLPHELLELGGLEVLKLRNNPLSGLPQQLAGLSHLHTLVLSFCLFTSLPQSVYNLPNLRMLDVSYNSITSLSDDIKNLRFLECLNMEGNHLTELPASFLSLRLREFRANNTFLFAGLSKEGLADGIIPQRLADLAATAVSRMQRVHVDTLPQTAALTQRRAGECDVCCGPRFGPGLRVLRSVSQVFGVRGLIFSFCCCSTTCQHWLLAQRSAVTLPVCLTHRNPDPQ